MPFFESEKSPNFSFQREITYSNPDLVPQVVAACTHNLFDLYFANHLEDDDKEMAHNFLARYTIPFIDAARSGLAEYPDLVDKLGKARIQDLLAAKSLDRTSKLPTDETHEILDYTLITMGALPEMVTKKYLDLENNEVILKFSKRGMFEPPKTLDQARLRIRELWSQTVRISQGFIEPSKYNFFNNPEVTRTIAFFDVARRLPLKYSNLVEEEEQLRSYKMLSEKFKNSQER